MISNIFTYITYFPIAISLTRTFLYFQRKFFLFTDASQDKYTWQMTNLQERDFFVCYYLTTKYTTSIKHLSFVTHSSFFCCANQDLIFQFYLLMWGLMAQWNDISAILACLKLQQSSEIQWNLTVTKYSVLLSYSSPFMGEDKEIVA